MIMRFRQLFRDRRGNSVIELALFAPVIATFLVGMSDLALGLTRKFQIEQASYRALELITVGSLQSDYNAYVKPEAATAAGVPLANVKVYTRLDCDSTVKKAFSETPFTVTDVCTSSQQTSRFVRVEVVTDYEPTFSYMADLMGGADGKVRLTSRSTLRVQ